MSDSLQPHELQLARFPCPSLSPSLLKLMSTELMMPSNYLILCRPLLRLPSIFPSIRIFSSELAHCVRWPKYWSFSSASVLPMNTQHWLPLGWTGWHPCCPRDHYNLKAWILQHSAFFMVQLTSVHDYWKNHSFDYTSLCQP